MGDFAAAQRYVDPVVSIAEKFGLRRLAITGRWFQHINAVRDRDLASLEAIREKLLPKGDEGKAIHLCVFHGVTASILLLRNDSASAIPHLESWRRAAHTYALKIHEASALVALAATHYEQDALDLALAAVEEGRKLTADSCLREEYGDLTMVGALVSSALGNRAQARAFLEEVFSEGTPMLWAMSLVPNNVPANVCALALKEGIAIAEASELIRRFRLSPPSPDIADWPWPLRIRTLGEFVIEAEEAMQGGRKVQRKPLELLKALIAFGCTNVDVQRLAEVVWSDLDGDAAMAAFHAALLRLRRLLGHEGLLQLQDGKLSLDQTRCWVDSIAIDHVFAAVERRAQAAGTEGAENGAHSLLELYRGDFLAEEEEKPWVLPARDRLRRRFLSCAADLGERLEAQQQWTQAMSLYQKALDANNLAEDVYRRLMRCHKAQGHYAEAIEAYRRCRDLLSIVLNAKPSLETDALYQEIQQLV